MLSRDLSQNLSQDLSRGSFELKLAQKKETRERCESVKGLPNYEVIMEAIESLERVPNCD